MFLKPVHLTSLFVTVISLFICTMFAHIQKAICSIVDAYLFPLSIGDDLVYTIPEALFQIQCIKDQFFKKNHLRGWKNLQRSLCFFSCSGLARLHCTCLCRNAGALSTLSLISLSFENRGLLFAVYSCKRKEAKQKYTFACMKFLVHNAAVASQKHTVICDLLRVV